MAAAALFVEEWLPLARAPTLGEPGAAAAAEDGEQERDPEERTPPHAYADGWPEESCDNASSRLP